MVAALVDAACVKPPKVQPSGRAGVATHQLLLAVLGAAQRERTRRAVLAELVSAWRHQASYANSIEELTPLHHDLISALPLIAASLATMSRPATWRWFSSGAVTNYALTPAGWSNILHRPGP